MEPQAYKGPRPTSLGAATIDRDDASGSNAHEFTGQRSRTSIRCGS